MGVVAFGLVTLVLVATTRLPEPAVEQPVPGEGTASRRSAPVGLPLLAIAAITFCAAFGEGMRLAVAWGASGGSTKAYTARS